MKKLLSLMHDTSGKTNRIKQNIDSIIKHLENDKSLNEPLHANGITIKYLLSEIKTKAIELDFEIDSFYLENKGKETEG